MELKERYEAVNAKRLSPEAFPCRILVSSRLRIIVTSFWLFGSSIPLLCTST